MKRMLAAALATLALANLAHASVVYNGGTYTEEFNTLPTDAPNNASIETLYLDGWQDDVDYTTSPQSDVSVPGWHLFHPLSPASENGFNGNQRFRIGTGANTGAFWGASSTGATDTEKALGSLGSNTVADPATNQSMYMALQLVNNTGQTLNNFTLTYDGEQFRDGQSPTGETLAFGYSLAATDADWATTAAYTVVPGLNFTSPVVGGEGTSGTAVDPNVAGRVADITATVTGISWAPGAELWLRWADPSLASLADDGLAIDRVRFTAIVPEPSGLALLALGATALLRRRRC